MLGRQPTSILTGRTMAEIAGDQGGEQSLKGEKGTASTKKMQAAAAAQNRKIAKAGHKGQATPNSRPLDLATPVDVVPGGNE